MTDERPQNERALTKEEKNDFLIELADLCLRYGVDFDVQNRYEGYESQGALDICDAFGNTIFESLSGFDRTNAEDILKPTQEL